MRLKLLPLAITLFWVAMMCSLVVQQIVPARRRAQTMLIEPEILALQWSDISEWHWIRKADQVVGGAVLLITQEALADPEQELGTADYRVYEALDIEVPVMGLKHEVALRLAMNLTPDFNVKEFAARIDTSPIAVRIEGFVEGDHLYYQVLQGGQPIVCRSLPLAGPPNLLAAIEPMLARHRDLNAGETYTVESLDPLGVMGTERVVVRSMGPETVVFEGEQVEATRIDTQFGEITRSRWVDDRGRTLRQELLNGLMSEASTRTDILTRFPDLNPDQQEKMGLLRIEIDRQDVIARAEATPAGTPDTGMVLAMFEKMMQGQ